MASESTNQALEDARYAQQHASGAEDLDILVDVLRHLASGLANVAKAVAALEEKHILGIKSTKSDRGK